MINHMLRLSLCLALTGCATIGSMPKPVGEAAHSRTDPAKPADFAFTLRQMDEFIQQVGKQDVAGRQAEVRRRLGKPEPTPADRLKLAYLLSLDNATQDDLGQAQMELEGLDAGFADSATRLYVRLLQRTVVAAAAQKQEKKRADELQDKLKQIKELELELMRRSQAKPAESK